MRTIWLLTLILGLHGIECRSGILKETSDHYKKLESLAELAVLELMSCYDKKVDTVGGIAMTVPALVVLMTKQPLPVKVFNQDEEEAGQGYKVERTAPHKLHLFVVDVASKDLQLGLSLWKALLSQASAHLATFLIIDWPSQNNQNDCSDSVRYLHWIWGWSILSAFYVCVDKLEDRVFVYTYNPYTSQAPEPWILNRTTSSLQDHPWSMFVREYQPGNQEICNNLDFDKTRDLGGYKIQCFHRTDYPFSQWTAQHAKWVLSSHSVSLLIFRHAMRALNASFDFYLTGRHGKTVLARNFLANNSRVVTLDAFDIFSGFISSAQAINLKTTIPVMNSDYAIATHHTGERSQLEKLIGVFDRTTRLSICVVIIGTVLFFKFFMHQPFGTATMNVIRIIGNTGLLIVPNGNAPRLVLAGVFILVVTIIGVYQGLLAALLTKPTPLPEIDTLEDLANSPHTIHLPSLDFTKFFKDPKFNGRLVHVKGICKTYLNGEIIVNPSDACLEHRRNLISASIKKNLHVSRETIVPAYSAYRIRENWPLEERFNKILTSFVESRIFWHLYDSDLERKIKIAEYKANVERERPTTMTLSNVGFAFAFLGLGLGLATIVLAIEIAMKRRELGQRMRFVRRVRANIKASVSRRANQRVCVVECS